MKPKKSSKKKSSNVPTVQPSLSSTVIEESVQVTPSPLESLSPSKRSKAAVVTSNTETVNFSAFVESLGSDNATEAPPVASSAKVTTSNEVNCVEKVPNKSPKSKKGKSNAHSEQNVTNPDIEVIPSSERVSPVSSKDNKKHKSSKIKHISDDPGIHRDSPRTDHGPIPVLKMFHRLTGVPTLAPSSVDSEADGSEISFEHDQTLGGIDDDIVEGSSMRPDKRKIRAALKQMRKNRTLVDNKFVQTMNEIAEHFLGQCVIDRRRRARFHPTQLPTSESPLSAHLVIWTTSQRLNQPPLAFALPLPSVDAPAPVAVPSGSSKRRGGSRAGGKSRGVVKPWKKHLTMDPEEFTAALLKSLASVRKSKPKLGIGAFTSFLKQQQSQPDMDECDDRMDESSVRQVDDRQSRRMDSASLQHQPLMTNKEKKTSVEDVVVPGKQKGGFKGKKSATEVTHQLNHIESPAFPNSCPVLEPPTNHVKASSHRRRSREIAPCLMSSEMVENTSPPLLHPSCSVGDLGQKSTLPPTSSDPPCVDNDAASATPQPKRRGRKPGTKLKPSVGAAAEDLSTSKEADMPVAAPLTDPTPHQIPANESLFSSPEYSHPISKPKKGRPSNKSKLQTTPQPTPAIVSVTNVTIAIPEPSNEKSQPMSTPASHVVDGSPSPVTKGTRGRHAKKKQPVDITPSRDVDNNLGHEDSSGVQSTDIVMKSPSTKASKKPNKAPKVDDVVDLSAAEPLPLRVDIPQERVTIKTDALIADDNHSTTSTGVTGDLDGTVSTKKKKKKRRKSSYPFQSPKKRRKQSAFPPKKETEVVCPVVPDVLTVDVTCSTNQTTHTLSHIPTKPTSPLRPVSTSAPQTSTNTSSPPLRHMHPSTPVSLPPRKRYKELMSAGLDTTTPDTASSVFPLVVMATPSEDVAPKPTPLSDGEQSAIEISQQATPLKPEITDVPVTPKSRGRGRKPSKKTSAAKKKPGAVGESAHKSTEESVPDQFADAEKIISKTSVEIPLSVPLTELASPTTTVASTIPSNNSSAKEASGPPKGRRPSKDGVPALLKQLEMWAPPPEKRSRREAAEMGVAAMVAASASDRPKKKQQPKAKPIEVKEESGPSTAQRDQPITAGDVSDSIDKADTGSDVTSVMECSVNIKALSPSKIPSKSAKGSAAKRRASLAISTKSTTASSEDLVHVSSTQSQGKITKPSSKASRRQSGSVLPSPNSTSEEAATDSTSRRKSETNLPEFPIKTRDGPLADVKTAKRPGFGAKASSAIGKKAQQLKSKIQLKKQQMLAKAASKKASASQIPPDVSTEVKGETKSSKGKSKFAIAVATAKKFFSSKKTSSAEEVVVEAEIKLPKQPAPYRKVRVNVYTDAKPNWHYEPQACACKRREANELPPPPKKKKAKSFTIKGKKRISGEDVSGEVNCGDNCLNRLVYMECAPGVCQCRELCSNQKIRRGEWAEGIKVQALENKGFGVIATYPITQGQFVVEYTGEVIKEETFYERMSTRYVDSAHHYCLHLHQTHLIDAYQVGSAARFVNHSCQPNCEMQKWMVNGYYRMCLFALSDITPGTELTYDYNFCSYNTQAAQPCFCGTPKCRGVIGSRPPAHVKDGSRERRPAYIFGRQLPHRERHFVREQGIFLVRNHVTTRLSRLGLPRPVSAGGRLPSTLSELRRSKAKQDQFLTQMSALNSIRSIRTRQLSCAEENEDLTRTAQLGQVLRDLYNTLLEAKDDQGKQLVSPFMHLLPKKKYPEYYLVLGDDNVICLSMIYQRLLEGRYADLDSFDRDVLLMLRNAEIYAGRRSWIGQVATTIRTLYKELKANAIALYEALTEVAFTPEQRARLLDSCGTQGETSSANQDDSTGQTASPARRGGKRGGKAKNSAVNKHWKRDLERGAEVIKCVCGFSLEANHIMLQCDRCFVWQHAACLNYARSDVADVTRLEPYFCNFCLNLTNISQEIPRQEQVKGKDTSDFWSLQVPETGLAVKTDDFVYVPRSAIGPFGSPVGASTPSTGNGGSKNMYDRLVLRIFNLWKDKNGQRWMEGGLFVRPYDVSCWPNKATSAKSAPQSKHDPDTPAGTHLSCHERELVYLDSAGVFTLPITPANCLGRCWVLNGFTYRSGRPVDLSLVPSMTSSIAGVSTVPVVVANGNAAPSSTMVASGDDVFLCEWMVEGTNKMKQIEPTYLKVNMKPYCFQRFDVPTTASVVPTGTPKPEDSPAVPPSPESSAPIGGPSTNKLARLFTCEELLRIDREIGRKLANQLISEKTAIANQMSDSEKEKLSQINAEKTKKQKMERIERLNCKLAQFAEERAREKRLESDLLAPVPPSHSVSTDSPDDPSTPSSTSDASEYTHHSRKISIPMRRCDTTVVPDVTGSVPLTEFIPPPREELRNLEAEYGLKQAVIRLKKGVPTSPVRNRFHASVEMEKDDATSSLADSEKSAEVKADGKGDNTTDSKDVSSVVRNVLASGGKGRFGRHQSVEPVNVTPEAVKPAVHKSRGRSKSISQTDPLPEEPNSVAINPDNEIPPQAESNITDNALAKFDLKPRGKQKASRKNNFASEVTKTAEQDVIIQESSMVGSENIDKSASPNPKISRRRKSSTMITNAVQPEKPMDTEQESVSALETAQCESKVRGGRKSSTKQTIPESSGEDINVETNLGHAPCPRNTPDPPHTSPEILDSTPKPDAKGRGRRKSTKYLDSHPLEVEKNSEVKSQNKSITPEPVSISPQINNETSRSPPKGRSRRNSSAKVTQVLTHEENKADEIIAEAAKIPSESNESLNVQGNIRGRRQSSAHVNSGQLDEAMKVDKSFDNTVLTDEQTKGESNTRGRRRSSHLYMKPTAETAHETALEVNKSPTHSNVSIERKVSDAKSSTQPDPSKIQTVAVTKHADGALTEHLTLEMSENDRTTAITEAEKDQPSPSKRGRPRKQSTSSTRKSTEELSEPLLKSSPHSKLQDKTIALSIETDIVHRDYSAPASCPQIRPGKPGRRRRSSLSIKKSTEDSTALDTAIPPIHVSNDTLNNLPSSLQISHINLSLTDDSTEISPSLKAGRSKRKSSSATSSKVDETDSVSKEAVLNVPKISLQPLTLIVESSAMDVSGSISAPVKAFGTDEVTLKDRGRTRSKSGTSPVMTKTKIHALKNPVVSEIDDVSTTTVSVPEEPLSQSNSPTRKRGRPSHKTASHAIGVKSPDIEESSAHEDLPKESVSILLNDARTDSSEGNNQADIQIPTNKEESLSSEVAEVLPVASIVEEEVENQQISKNVDVKRTEETISDYVLIDDPDSKMETNDKVSDETIKQVQNSPRTLPWQITDEKEVDKETTTETVLEIDHTIEDIIKKSTENTTDEAVEKNNMMDETVEEAIEINYTTDEITGNDTEKENESVDTMDTLEKITEEVTNTDKTIENFAEKETTIQNLTEQQLASSSEIKSPTMNVDDDNGQIEQEKNDVSDEDSMKMASEDVIKAFDTDKVEETKSDEKVSISNIDADLSQTCIENIEVQNKDEQHPSNISESVEGTDPIAEQDCVADENQGTHFEEEDQHVNSFNNDVQISSPQKQDESHETKSPFSKDLHQETLVTKESQSPQKDALNEPMVNVASVDSTAPEETCSEQFQQDVTEQHSTIDSVETNVTIDSLTISEPQGKCEHQMPIQEIENIEKTNEEHSTAVNIESTTATKDTNGPATSDLESVSCTGVTSTQPPSDSAESTDSTPKQQPLEPKSIPPAPPAVASVSVPGFTIRKIRQPLGGGLLGIGGPRKLQRPAPEKYSSDNSK